jgi:hypothetical protein
MSIDQRIIVSEGDDYDVRHAFSAAGVNADSRRVAQLLSLAVLIGKPDDEVESWVSTPKLPPGTIGMMMMKTYYNVNISRTSIAVAGALLDAVATAGLASAALAVTGMTKQSVARLDPLVGEYCNMVHVAKLGETKQAINPEAVATMISGKPCPFREAGCRLNKDGVCGADVAAIAANFRSLSDKGALETSGGQWSAPL